jgi:phospho-N-acetylmuramoyl-pentapeptide-transferase
MTALLWAGAISFSVSIFGMPILMRWLASRGIGQPIRKDGPKDHHRKSGTPTMGGVMIVIAAVAGYMIPHFVTNAVPFSRGGQLVLLAFVGSGAVGLADDWIKVTRKRSLGLNKRAKIISLFSVAVTFSVLAVRYANVKMVIGFTRFSNPGWKIPPVLWVLFAVFIIVGTTNGVNLTDGLDGLAGGSSMFAFVAYTVMAFWMFRHVDHYQVPQALDIAVFAAAMVGACAGFLWWNAFPARIFMGDVGALAIGAAFGSMAIITYTPLLLPVIGALFVFETLSVIIQVFTFRVMGGRRIFRMAPIHHHFELGGWPARTPLPETTVIVRFWIIAMIVVSFGLGIFYADFLSSGGID